MSRLERDPWELLDPELRVLFEAPTTPVLSVETYPAMRAMMAAIPRPPSGTGGCEIEERWIEGAGQGRLRLLIFSRCGRSGVAPGLLHLHPGGWVLGSPEMSCSTLLAIVEALDCVIVSVDYRLAPEHPFPAATDDAWAGLEWMVSNAATLGIDPQRVGLLGESAGANIAAGLSLRVRDEQAHPLVVQSLIYPAFDDRSALQPPHPYAGQIGLGLQSMRFAWSALLGQDPGSEGISAYAAPARAANLDGLPATFMAIGALDPFIDENLDFAGRLIRAGVPTELHVYPGSPHAFDRQEGASVTKALRRDRAAFLSRVLGGG